VSLCEAVYQGTAIIEGMEAVKIERADEAEEVINQGKVPVLVDPEGESIELLRPAIVIDAILAKKNLGTHRDMAGLTIALGPGFTAGEDVDYVIETKRGHNLGRIITQGSAAPNSGVPGNIGGYTKERVIHASAGGTLYNVRNIGDIVKKGEIIAVIKARDETIPVEATINGIIRGLIRDGYPVTCGFKIADIDPRQEELKNCFTISDKARCIAGSSLEVVSGYMNRRKGGL
jgi:xanthine dehydrogenase accessory factor